MKENIRIKDAKEFNFIIKNGKKNSNSFFSIYYIDKKYDESRFGITLIKKFGNAVKRNYYKRVLREIIRNNINMFLNKYDYIIIIKKDCEKISFSEIENIFIDLIKKEKK